MWRRLLLGLVAAATSVFVSQPSLADGLLVSPTLVEFGERDRATALTLINPDGDPQTYRIRFINYRQNTDGSYDKIEKPEGDRFAGEYIRYAPRQVELPPGEPQTVRLMLRAPPDLPAGEYRSHLLIQQVPKARPRGENPDGIGTVVRPVYGVTIPVIFRRGDLDFTVGLENVSVSTASNGKLMANASIIRGGDMSVRGDMVVLDGGEEIGRLNNLAVYLTTPRRDVQVPLTRRPTGAIRVELREREGERVLAEATASAR